VEENVLKMLKVISGHQQIARMQGSATLALEIIACNFLKGDALIVSTGYYSDRLKELAQSSARRFNRVGKVDSVSWNELDGVTGRYDWICACLTETSVGIKLDPDQLSGLKKRTGARLMLDATASIGLEQGHHLADVIGYSSCKGLFGLTGASFIAFNESPRLEVDSFYLNLDSHLEKRMTGPYHAICSLHEVLPKHEFFRMGVVKNKRIFTERMKDHLVQPLEHQPLLCTHVSLEVTAQSPESVLYRPRGSATGSVICHLGEAHLGEDAEGRILDQLVFKE
jgi:2-aminoethylphosphonate-pyruvate transaminase